MRFKKTEIGSEFWDVPLKETEHSVFEKFTVWFLSGRVALTAILKDICKQRLIRKVLLPSWCCDSMITPFLETGAKVEFYGVLIADKKVFIDYPQHTDADIVLIMDYFGFKNESEIPEYDCIKIRDVTHSMFSCVYDDADYYFGSLRKWAGFFTGGFAYKASGVLDPPTEQYLRYVEMRKNAMSLKKEYICGKTDDKAFLSVFRNAETLLDGIDKIYSADIIDIERAKNIDVKKVRTKRRKNAEVLMSHLKKFTIFDLHDNDCPLFVPIIVSNRDEVKNALISNQIYCPCHWGISEYHNLMQSERQIYENEISLVCDQRYDEADMNRICEVVEKVAKEC